MAKRRLVDFRFSAILLLAVIGGIVAFRPGTTCGNNEPHIVEHARRLSVSSQPQRYLAGGDVNHLTNTRRNLDAETYPTFANSSFVPIQTAQAVGLTRNLRITLRWDMIDALDMTNNPRMQCRFPGDAIALTNGQTGWNGCVAEDAVNATDPSCADDVMLCRYALLKERTAWAANYWQQTIKVKPVLDNITLSPYIISGFNLTDPSSFVHNNTDLVVFVTARPQPNTNIAAFALCLQRDQYGRCTVGQFNWVPKLLAVSSQYSPDSIADERHTAVHEFVHVLGGMSVGYNGNTPFIDNNGNMRTVSDLIVTERDGPGYSKIVTKVRTPKVLAIIREQFNCSTISGMTLEDIPMAGGYSVHWEARIAGPELMSYGTGSGETYVADYTLAFLEDTNQYIANYSMAGRLFQSTLDTDEGGDLVASDFLRDRVQIDNITITQKSPGYVRWGRQAGCAFFTGNARDWSLNYRCTRATQYGCSSDNRVASVCQLRSGITVNRVYSCGGYDPTGAGNNVCNNVVSTCAASSGCTLPGDYQYFSTSSSVGGWSDAMDEVPVMLGYWNCQDDAPASEILIAKQRAETGGNATNYTPVVPTTKEAGLFGGQSHCPDCRCFVSSLQDLSRLAFNPTFPQYGMCYRSNCYKADYLQFAIRSQFNNRIDWYKCPSGGGKLHIPGYTGAFHCPAAKDFCSQEKITGVKYPETVLWLEWLFWSVVFSIPFTLGCVCLYDGPRRWLNRKSKRCCGAGVFLRRRKLPEPADDEDVSLYSLALVAPPKRPARALLLLNVATFIAGAVVFATCIYFTRRVFFRAITSPFLALPLFVIILSVLGMLAAYKRAHGVSNLLLLYFFMAILACILLMWMVIWAFGFNYTLKLYVAHNWSVMSEFLECCYDPSAPQSDQIASATSTLQHWMVLCGVGGLLVFFLFAISLVIAGWVAKSYLLMSTTYFVFNYFFLVAGGLILIVSAVLMSEGDSSSTVAQIALVAGIYLSGVMFFGLVGAWKKRFEYIFAHSVMTMLVCIATAVAAWYAYSKAADAPSIVANISTSMVKLLTDDSTFGMTADDMVIVVKANLQQLGVFFIFLTLLLAVLSGVSLAMGFVMKRMRDKSAKKRAMHAANSRTNLLLSPVIRNGELLTSPPHIEVPVLHEPTPSRTRHKPLKGALKVKIDSALAKAEAAAKQEEIEKARGEWDKRSFAITTDGETEYTLNSPDPSVRDPLPSTVGSAVTTPFRSGPNTPAQSRGHSATNSLGNIDELHEDIYASVPHATSVAKGGKMYVIETPMSSVMSVDPGDERKPQPRVQSLTVSTVQAQQSPVVVTQQGSPGVMIGKRSPRSERRLLSPRHAQRQQQQAAANSIVVMDNGITVTPQGVGSVYRVSTPKNQPVPTPTHAATTAHDSGDVTTENNLLSTPPQHKHRGFVTSTNDYVIIASRSPPEQRPLSVELDVAETASGDVSDSISSQGNSGSATVPKKLRFKVGSHEEVPEKK